MLKLDNIKNLIETMALVDNLDDPDFLKENDLTDEAQIAEIRKELTAKMLQYKWQIEQYVDYKLEEMQKYTILTTGIDAQIKKLQDRKTLYVNTAERIKKWIDYIMQLAGISKLETVHWKLSYLSSSTIEYTSTENIPGELIKKQYQLSDEWWDWVVDYMMNNPHNANWTLIQETDPKINKNDLKKWYKWLPKEEQTKLLNIVYTEKKNLQIK